MISISTNSLNWELVWQQTFDAINTTLPRLFSPTVLTSPVVAIACNISNFYWDKQAVGWINQHINTGLVGMGAARVTKNRLIFSRELTLIDFPFKADYQISFDLFTKVASSGELRVWEYTGVIN